MFCRYHVPTLFSITIGKNRIIYCEHSFTLVSTISKPGNAAFDEKTTQENLKVPLWLYYVLQVPFPDNVATTFSEQYVGTVPQWFPGNAP